MGQYLFIFDNAIDCLKNYLFKILIFNKWNYIIKLLDDLLFFTVFYIPI